MKVLAFRNKEGMEIYKLCCTSCTQIKDTFGGMLMSQCRKKVLDQGMDNVHGPQAGALIRLVDLTNDATNYMKTHDCLSLHFVHD
jgi:hypothetical protein